MAEPYLDHPRELEVAIVGDVADHLEAFGPGEVHPAASSTTTWRSTAPAHPRATCRPTWTPIWRRRSGAWRAHAFLAIGAGGFARVDFLLSREGLLYLSEINTIPGFTPISLFPLLCASGGYDFGGICERIVGLALERAALAPTRQLTRSDLP